ncbi:MAG: hypothetical protein Q7R34_04875 [Dehalococcoidia bacterium]|nr:hypothetical protein [Dehalococcoidia bacterium]
MDKGELPDELKKFADVIEILGFDRGLTWYGSASLERQQRFRLALWKAQQSMNELQEELGVKDPKVFADLYSDLLHATLGMQNEQVTDSN